MKPYFIFLIILSVFVFGCAKTGIQGGDLKNKFSGVENTKALSPTTIQLTWSLDSRYNSFKVYMGGSDKPIKSETFSQSIINNLVPNTSYSFTVTGVKSDGTGAEEGFSQSFAGSTLPSFNGITSEMVSDRSKNAVRFKLTPSSDVVTYQLFTKIRNADWDFNKVTDQGSSASEVLLSASSLAGGTHYCFFIIAKYLDGTSEPATTDLAKVNKQAVCETTENSIPPATVTMNPIIPGAYPWFNVAGGADGSTTVEIRRLNTDEVIASRQGVGELRASIPIEAGIEEFYALTSTSFGKATSALTLQPEPTGSRAGKSYIRTLVSDKADAKGPLFPELFNKGRGVQKLGQKIVTGDFNCDGIPDVAVSAPEATPFGDPTNPTIDPNHFIKTGAVIIYYGMEKDVLNSSGAKIDTTRYLNTTEVPLPSNQAPHPQLVYYSMAQSNTLLGTQLAVGNINGDCRSLKLNSVTNQLETAVGYCDDFWYNVGTTGYPNQNEIASCDDLAISSNEGRGAVYLLYGNPNGGFNTSAGVQPGNNDFACVSGGACQAMKYTPDGTNTIDSNGDLSLYSSFGRSIAFGDFDNDGYDELAIGAVRNNQGVVMVLKGSDSGLYPPVYNIIPTVGDFNKGNTRLKILSETSTSFQHSSVGFSVTAVPDSRLCRGNDANIDSNGFRPTIPAGSTDRLARSYYDFSKCDDLVMGAPGLDSSRGSIFSCAAILNDSTYEIDSWSCQQHRPSTGAANDEYGYSVLGLRNLNSYPMGTLRTSQPASITGALAVGSPGKSSGLVYMYYVTPFDADDKVAASASGTGGIQKVLSDLKTNITFTSGAATSGSITHAIESVDDTACDYTNKNRTVGTTGNSATFVRWGLNPTNTTEKVESCNRQSISMQPSLTGARFGHTLSLLPDMAANSSNRFLSLSGAPMLAISAPYATVPSVKDSSINITNHGMVKIFQLDVSEAVAASGGTQSYPFRYSPTSTYYYGGGINPFGSVTIYSADLAASSLFGSGGVAGGYFYKDPLPSLIQVVAAGEGNTVDSSILNGSVSVFKAKTKQLNYIEQKCTGTCPSGISNLEVSPNVSIETAYHFEMAQIAGDFNGDGYEDVVARSILGNRARVAIYYGSANGLIKSPNPSRVPKQPLDPLLLEFPADIAMGMKFSKVGSVNGDAFDDLLLIGSEGAYIFYGSFAGLIANADPSTAPNGTYPLWFGKNQSSPSIYLYASSTGSNINGSTLASNFETIGYNSGNDGITYGDFNGDGSSDIAFSVTDSTYDNVLVVFGSTSGLQVNKVTNPGRFASTDVVTWTASGTINNSTYCNMDASLGATLLSQARCFYFGSSSSAISSGKSLIIRAALSAGNFGRQITSIKPDHSLDTSSYTNNTASLVVSDQFTVTTGVYASSIYTFNVAGSQMKTDGARPLLTVSSNTYYQIRSLRIANAGDVNGDKVPDLLITSDNDVANPGMNVRVIYGKSASSVLFDTFVSDVTQINARTQAMPFWSSSTAAASQYGIGIGSAGDFNGDGYGDIFINSPMGDNVSSTSTVADTGYVTIVFGSADGLRIKSGTIYSTPSITPKCYGGPSIVGICEPFNIFLPDSNLKEYTYISEKSVGDINGDGIPDLLIGGFGRDNVNGPGYSTGVIYVLY